MRHVPHPVVVVTTSTSDAPTDTPSSLSSSPRDSDPSALAHSYAATLSSFTTVTLGPPAVVTFNLRRPSRTLDALLARRFFRVHVLRADADGAAIAAAFVDGAHGAALERLNERGFGVRMEGFRGAGGAGRGWAPSFGRGSLFAFDCEVLQDKVLVVGDHAVVFAAVRWAPKTDGWRETEESSLLYYFRDYGLAGRLPGAEAVKVETTEEEKLEARKA
jgi:flavin reductase (DIM6/NTAB) family NADH-FMN oxidoreductase RutF